MLALLAMKSQLADAGIVKLAVTLQSRGYIVTPNISRLFCPDRLLVYPGKKIYLSYKYYINI